jgi:hypothetical protein
MTANELIETAEKAKTWEYDITDDWIKNASTMLRQQQAEIEVVKKLYKDLYLKFCAIENILQKL